MLCLASGAWTDGVRAADVEFLVLRVGDDTKEYRITDALEIRSLHDGTVAVSDGVSTPVTLPCDEIRSMGVVTRSIVTGVDAVAADVDESTPWAIFDTSGRRLRSGAGVHPDFRGLATESYFIVKHGDSTYKYKPLK